MSGQTLTPCEWGLYTWQASCCQQHCGLLRLSPDGESLLPSTGPCNELELLCRYSKASLLHLCYRRHAAAGSKSTLLFAPWQLLCAAPFVWFHTFVVHRICYASYSWPALLFSPGLAWCMPLLALLLITARRGTCLCTHPGKKGC